MEKEKGLKLRFSLDEQLELTSEENCVEVRAIVGNGLCTFSKKLLRDTVNGFGVKGINWTLVNELTPYGCDDLFDNRFRILPDVMNVYETEDYEGVKTMLDHRLNNSDKTQLFVFYGKGMRKESYDIVQIGRGKNVFFLFINEVPKQQTVDYMSDVIIDVKLDKDSQKQSVTITRP